jgi:pimeloyl-ACP methyl ester carboxylesterase
MVDTEHLTFEHGELTFSAQAMGDGPIVLCLHGFPDNAGSFRHQLPALSEAGYRAISLTLRGYEPRSIPAGWGLYRGDDCYRCSRGDRSS